MFEKFFGEQKDFASFKADWIFECNSVEDRQLQVDTLMHECVPARGEQVLFALVLLFQAVKPSSRPLLVALEKARYLRYFYDSSTNTQIRQAFLYLVKKKAFVVTHSRPFRVSEPIPLGPESSSSSIHERLLFLKNILQTSPIVSIQELATLKALLARYQESKLLSTCPLSLSAASEDLDGLMGELGRVVGTLDSFSDAYNTSPQPRSSIRSRFSVSNPVFPANELRRSVSAPPQRKRASSTLRSDTPPLESISNMPDIQF
jgi:hypothetical protein